MTPPLTRALLRASWHSWVRNDLRTPHGPAWLQWVWTLLFCLALSAVFTVFGFLLHARGMRDWASPANWARWYGHHLIVCLTVGCLIHLLHDLARRRLGGPAALAHWRPWQRAALLGGIPVTGLLLGWPLGLALTGFDLAGWMQRQDSMQQLVAVLLLSLLITLLMTAWSAGRVRQMDAERRSTEARLLLLQGQIEPHFLFNTLAGVVALIDVDPPQARRLLQEFTDYLRAALGALRQAEAPLAQELALVGHYLALMGARMEDRLQVRIDADADARGVAVPPLLLQPLVENAIVHGLEPGVDGGTVRIHASLQGGRLRLEVQDDGCGPGHARATPGALHHGMALANLRDRLAARYGPDATLTMTATHPGTRVVIDLPASAAD